MNLFSYFPSHLGLPLLLISNSLGKQEPPSISARQRCLNIIIDNEFSLRLTHLHKELELSKILLNSIENKEAIYSLIIKPLQLLEAKKSRSL